MSRRSFLGGSALLATAIALPPAVARPTEIDTGLVAAIDGVATSSIQAGACPGIAIEISLRGRPLLARQYGLANIETNSPVTAASVLRIGSLTKQFTAALVVLLAAQGKLALDDAVSKHLPWFDANQSPTLRELLNHTAGLHDDPQATSCTTGPAGPKSQLQLAREISRQDKLFDFGPGTAWLYSNANYIVLGAVVEAITNQSLSDAATRMIFKPLGLAHTGFDTADAVVPGRADGYSAVAGHPGAFTHAAFLDISEAGGAGAMRSTTADLCRWHAALFANRLFDARWVQTMLAPGQLRDGRPSGSNRFSPDDASYGDVQYAMGLLVSRSPDGHRSALHYGFVNGFAACLETIVDSGLTMAILCNADMSPALPFRALRRIVSARLLPGLSAVR